MGYETIQMRKSSHPIMSIAVYVTQKWREENGQCTLVFDAYAFAQTEHQQ